MSTRKIILLSVIAALLAIYCVQLVSAGRNTVENIIVAEDISQLRIQKSGSDTVVLAKDGENWFVRFGENGTPVLAEESVVLRALAAVKEIKVLETVSRSGDDERYGFDGSSFTVEAYSGGKKVRTVVTGKRAETGLQSYVKLDDSPAVKLISGTPSLDFGKNADDWIKKMPDPPSESAAELPGEEPVLQSGAL